MLQINLNKIQIYFAFTKCSPVEQKRLFGVVFVSCLHSRAGTDEAHGCIQFPSETDLLSLTKKGKSSTNLIVKGSKWILERSLLFLLTLSSN
jgi:hypothetical protein